MVLHDPWDKNMDSQVSRHAGTNTSIAQSSSHLCTRRKLLHVHSLEVGGGTVITIKSSSYYFICARL